MDDAVDFFNEFDADGDGKLSGQELVDCLQIIRQKAGDIKGLGALLESIDKDGDGEIELTEWVEHLPVRPNCSLPRQTDHIS
jgi:Ca2+-binding EF-hand superfamily protein